MDCPNSLPDSPGLDNLTTQHEHQERFVDANALAAHLSVARRQVLEMTRRGVIPGHPLGVGTSRRVWRYKISEVEAAIATVVRKPDAPQKSSPLAVESTRRKMAVGSPCSRKEKSNG